MELPVRTFFADKTRDMDDIQTQKRSRRGGGRDARRTARQAGNQLLRHPIWCVTYCRLDMLAMKPVS